MNAAESKVSRAQRRYKARIKEKNALKTELEERQAAIEACRAEK